MKTIITPGADVADADITGMITLADAEITGRGFDSKTANLRKQLSMLLTAEMIAGKHPASISMNPLASSQPQTPDTFRKRAEELIKNAMTTRSILHT